MRLHITRHGQVDQRTDHPVGDPYLSDLGREQARRLGARLKEEGFAGTVHASPYLRTMETGQIVAEIVAAPMMAAPPMREYVIREGQMDAFEGMTQDALMQRYSRLVENPAFVYPWWTDTIESPEDIEDRVAPLIQSVITMDEDALLVGHGASIGGAHRHVLKTYFPDRLKHGRRGWNCVLSSFAFGDRAEVVRIMDTEHLPEEMITANAKSKAEVLAEAGSE